MAAGDILREDGMRIETHVVKANEDIELGEICIEDGAGMIAAAATDEGPFYMAMKAHDYSEETVHTIQFLAEGDCECQKVAAGGLARKGQYCEISATQGAVQVWDYATPGEEWGIVGVAIETSTDAQLTQKLRLGQAR